MYLSCAVIDTPFDVCFSVHSLFLLVSYFSLIFTDSRYRHDLFQCLFTSLCSSVFDALILNNTRC